jgi:cytochrome c
MRRQRVVALALGLALASAGGVAPAAADAAAGKKVFNKCKACHVADQEKNRVGPHLVGIMGRPAGAVADFKYSSAMKDSGITWDADTLSQYLHDPKGFVPGNKMAFVGLKKDQEVTDVIEYLTDPAAVN